MGDETRRVENHPCDACGQLDDHPMIHVGNDVWKRDGHVFVQDPSFHFDCLPPDYRALLGTPETHPQHANTWAAIEAAEAGVHGDELVTHIAQLSAKHNDNEVEAPADTPIVPGVLVSTTAETVEA